jgi:tRNA (cmo5U34)-methyltransferase
MQKKPVKDKIFAIDAVEEDFVFSEKVVEVFDDMLDRSIPFYKTVIHLSAQLAGKNLGKGDTVYDLGCATGTTLLEFARLLGDRELLFTGMDNSEPMLDKARLKAEIYKKNEQLSFVHGDITEFEGAGIGCIVLNYTLQFIRPLQRVGFLKKLFDALRPGGIILMSEKVISHDRKLNRDFIDLYHQYKKTKGYSELEISKKREALENVLIPFSIDENREMLEKGGFMSIETYFQYLNFVSFIGIKPL